MASTRVKNVQELRRIAGAHNVARVPDNASKEKVKAMVEELQSKSLTPEDSDKVQSEWAAYRATHPGWLDEP